MERIFKLRYPESMIDDPERISAYISRHGNTIETAEGANIAALLLTSLNAISDDDRQESILQGLFGEGDIGEGFNHDKGAMQESETTSKEEHGQGNSGKGHGSKEKSADNAEIGSVKKMKSGQG